MVNDYDVLVVGGGLAGLTAALFAARYGLKTGLVERTITGGQIINAERIDNFPGFPDGITGADLTMAVQEQAEAAGATLMLAEATEVAQDGNYKWVLTEGSGYRAKAVIVATGSRLRKLGLPKEEELYGRGYPTAPPATALSMPGRWSALSAVEIRRQTRPCPWGPTPSECWYSTGGGSCGPKRRCKSGCRRTRRWR